MLEMLVNVRKAERHPIEMFFIGILYASIAVLLVQWIFSKDAVLAKYSGLLIVTFTVMFSLPFIYFAFRREEQKDLEIKDSYRLLREHGRMMIILMWLFLGFVVAFAFWYMVIPSSLNFQAQVETYCMINRPAAFENCVSQYTGENITTGGASSSGRFLAILSNNIYVMMFTLIFSLVFGAGAIFILAWNASVISAAVGIYTQSSISKLPMGLSRYMIHGIPEIAAYFVTALAGGIIGVAMINGDIKTRGVWRIVQDVLNLLIIAVVILIVAAAIEVYVTPILF